MPELGMVDAPLGDPVMVTVTVLLPTGVKPEFEFEHPGKRITVQASKATTASVER